jgi:hypothetical protein
MKCQRCEALADHVGLLLKENQILRERVAELERSRSELRRIIMDRAKGEPQQ